MFALTRCLSLKGSVLSALLVLGSVTAGIANEASTLMPLTSDSVTLSVTGEDNLLYISQSPDPAMPSPGQLNRMEITITGDRNGGFGDSWFGGFPKPATLMPGQLIQAGFGNILSLVVDGQDNRFAMLQSGDSNRVTGRITGFGNQAHVKQTGMSNLAVFSQNGQGNTIMVSQQSW